MGRVCCKSSGHIGTTEHFFCAWYVILSTNSRDRSQKATLPPIPCRAGELGTGPRAGPSGVLLPMSGSRWRCGPGLTRTAGRWKGGGNPERKTCGKQGFRKKNNLFQNICLVTGSSINSEISCLPLGRLAGGQATLFSAVWKNHLSPAHELWPPLAQPGSEISWLLCP